MVIRPFLFVILVILVAGSHGLAEDTGSASEETPEAWNSGGPFEFELQDHRGNSLGRFVIFLTDELANRMCGNPRLLVANLLEDGFRSGGILPSKIAYLIEGDRIFVDLTSENVCEIDMVLRGILLDATVEGTIEFGSVPGLTVMGTFSGRLKSD